MRWLLALLIAQALAHEGEQWIAEKQLTDPVTKAWCCGPQDCKQLPDGAVTEIHGGWRVVLDDEHDAVFVQRNRALPVSPDGHYNICRDGRATVRCFITPPPAS